MQLSQVQLNLLRSHPHGTKLWLSIYKPPVLCAGIITGNPSRGAMSVTISVTSGSTAAIYPGVTLLVGTSAGADDVGRIRIRSASGNTINVAENAIEWANGLHVTTIGQIDITAIYPRIIQDPNNEENVIFYKDYDIAYTNQNLNMGSLICMGSHYAGFLQNGSHQVYYTSTGTVSVNGGAITYQWEFQGGTPSTSNSATPGFVTYTAPGHYRTKLTVTTNGVSDVSYRYISIYDRPENGTFTPILDWTLKDFSGGRAEGGYTLSLVVRQNVADVQPNAIVVLFADEFYGQTNGSLGGNQQNRSHIKFVGYILEDTIKYNYRTSEVSFKVGSITELMKKAEGFSISVESKASPTSWYEIYDMDVVKAIYHYVKWHSTINLIADIQYTGRNTKFQYFDTDRSSLYEALHSFMSNSLLGNVVADRQGKIWLEIEPRGNESPLNYPTAMTLMRQDWIDAPEITEKRLPQTSFIELGGIAYSGAITGTFSAHISNAPSETPLYHGSHREEKGLIITGQAQLNAIAGNMLAIENSRFPEIQFSLRGNYSNLDIAPIEFVEPVIEAQDTFRGITITGKKYMIESMDWNYDPVSGLFRPDIIVKHVTTGSAGVTIQIPDVPEDSGFSVPNIQIPLPPPSSISHSYFNNFRVNCSDILACLPQAGGYNCEIFAYKITATASINESKQITITPNYVSNPYMYQPSTGFTFLNSTPLWYKLQFAGGIKYNGIYRPKFRVEFIKNHTTHFASLASFSLTNNFHDYIDITMTYPLYLQFKNPDTVTFRVTIYAYVPPAPPGYEYFEITNFHVIFTQVDSPP